VKIKMLTTMFAICILLNIHAKNQKTGTLLTTRCKSLNYNEVQPQIKQRNKEENINNDTFYLAKLSGCWT